MSPVTITEADPAAKPARFEVRRALRLTIPRRLGLLIGAAVIVSVAAFGVQLLALRATLLEDRQVAVRSEVETAASTIRYFVAEAAAGRLSKEEAQERAKA
ncbi:MAG TPA: hypothetical protein VMU85_09105, partial [Stellaceae bacterium]|nr:hypothetical protein [Stellaceae bacterium]